MEIENIDKVTSLIEHKPTAMKTGINTILEERLRQLTVKGYDSVHDDTHKKGELYKAAALYAWPALSDYVLKHEWPEGKAFYHPSEPKFSREAEIRDLAKAGALIVAELDRLYRLELKEALEKGQ